MRFDFDTSDLDKLADSLDEAKDEARKAAKQVVAKGALNIKKDARRRISGHVHLPHYPSSITYDLEAIPDGWQAEIGPDKRRRQGPLGNILEYGTARTAPMPHLGPAADAEAPKFARALEDAIAKVLEQ